MMRLFVWSDASDGLQRSPTPKATELRIKFRHPMRQI